MLQSLSHIYNQQEALLPESHCREVATLNPYTPLQLLLPNEHGPGLIPCFPVLQEYHIKRTAPRTPEMINSTHPLSSSKAKISGRVANQSAASPLSTSWEPEKLCRCQDAHCIFEMYQQLGLGRLNNLL
jgi:hypothetical protein